MPAFTVTVHTRVAGGEPADYSELQHALFNAMVGSDGLGDNTSGAFASFDEDTLQVVLLVDSLNSDMAGLVGRAIVIEVLAQESMETTSSVEVTDIVVGRGPFDELMETYER